LQQRTVGERRGARAAAREREADEQLVGRIGLVGDDSWKPVPRRRVERRRQLRVDRVMRAAGGCGDDERDRGERRDPSHALPGERRGAGGGVPGECRIADGGSRWKTMRYGSSGAVFSNRTVCASGEKLYGGPSVTVCTPRSSSKTMFVLPCGVSSTSTSRVSSKITRRNSIGPSSQSARSRLKVCQGHTGEQEGYTIPRAHRTASTPPVTPT